MKMTLCFIGIFLFVSRCAAQDSTFDVFTYRPPEFFTCVALPSKVQFSFANSDTSFCRITLFKTQPAKNSAGKDVLSQWSQQVAGHLKGADKKPGRILEGRLWDGWVSTVAIGNFYQAGKKCVVMLNSFRKGDLSCFVVFAFSDKSFKGPVEDFSRNLHLIQR